MDNRYATSRSNYIFRGFTDHSSGEKENAYCFQKRGGKIDWKKIAAIDVDNFEDEYNINVLVDNIPNFVFCSIESEIDVKSVNPAFIKLFKVGQLIAEYLLHAHNHMATTIDKMQQKSPKPGNELKEKYEYNAENEDVPERSKKTSNKDPVIGAVSCSFCYKVFENSKYVIRHIRRRHPEKLSAGIKTINSSIQADQGIDNTLSQKEITDFMAKGMNELKQFFDKSIEKAKCEIEKSVDLAVNDLKNQNENAALNETRIVQILDKWKKDEEEKHNADLEKMEREFANKLHKLNLKVSDTENIIQNLEEKFLLSIQEVKKELFHSMEIATGELLNKYKTGFSEIKHELQTQLAVSYEKCLMKLDQQDLQLKDGMAEIHHETSIELENFKVLLETTLSKLSGIESVHDLQQELKRYLELCYAKCQRKAQKKQNKSKSKSQSSRGITQNMISNPNLATKVVADPASGNILEVKLNSHIKNRGSKRIRKSNKHLKAFCDQSMGDVQVFQTHENVNRSSRSLRSLSENKTGVTPIIVRPVVTVESKVNSEKVSDFHEKGKQHGEIKNCSETEVTSGNNVTIGSKKVLFVKTSNKSQNSVVGSWLQGEKANCDAINEDLNVVHPVKMFELQGNKEFDDVSESISMMSEENKGYHETKRLIVALQVSPDLVNGLHHEVLDAVRDKMEKIGAKDMYMTDADFSEKIDLINTEKHLAAQKYLDYYDIRNWYNKYADQAVEMQMHGGGNKRRISFANPEVTAEVKRSSSEAEEFCNSPDQSNLQPRISECSSPSQDGFSIDNSDKKSETNVSQTRLCQSLPMGKGDIRELPPKPESLGPYSCPKFLHSDLSSDSSLESLGYPFKENLDKTNKEQEECDGLDEDSTSGKELSSWDGDDLSS